MKITFHLPYKTIGTEQLGLSIQAQSGNRTLQKTSLMHSTDQAHWTYVLDINAPSDVCLTYSYQVHQNNQISRTEWNARPRQITLQAEKIDYQIYDFWRDLPQYSWLYSTAFSPVISPKKITEFSSTFLLRAQIPGIGTDQQPCLCGEDPVLGEWDPKQALPLYPLGANEWAISIDANTVSATAYKFILKEKNGSIHWEQGPNRLLPATRPPAGHTWVYSGLYPVFPRKQPRAAGVVIPVFSIRTQDDWGIGDFGSLRKLTDWAAQTGQKMIQILPITDTSLTHSWQDSYPYNSVSVYAFHPIYADLSALPPLSSWREHSFQKKRQQLNVLPQIDYEAVYQLKLKRLRLAYKKEGEQVLTSAPFQQFWQENSTWLETYAMFSALRDKFGTPQWKTWPQYATFSTEKLRAFFAKDSKDRRHAYFYLYVQFKLHEQLLQAHQYAHSRGISLKGDIPIGVSPYSADAWAEPELFHLNAQAGAPPDNFSKTGQNWGFPTYNWQAMARDGYRWWKKRFEHMTRYFDAYRIDHVLGFFRIWQIPLDSVEGLLGQFSPALALQEADIKSFGFDFQETYTTPLITAELVEQLFGAEASWVYTHCLNQTGKTYQLREPYHTQRSIQQAFAGKTDSRSLQLQGKLFALCNNVLFVRDQQDPTAYHPRISALSAPVFQQLTKPQQQAYTRLYNDYFFQRQDEFWKKQALDKLPALTQSTPMLCCAEDLGMIPSCVPEVMQRLQMVSLEIQRMPKRLGETFANPACYPYLSVATPSTHDMSVLRGWWKEDPALSKRFWKEILGRSTEVPSDLPAEACQQILQMHLQSPSMLCLIAWQDWLSMDEYLRTPEPDAERINVPANPKHYWCYRMHLTVEEMLQQKNFNKHLLQLIHASGR